MMSRSRVQTVDLIWLLAKTDFQLRYQGSVFGFFWALLKPLFVFTILLAVFSQLFSGQVEHYALQLLLGIFMWNFFAEGTTMGMNALLSKAHVLRKIVFPKWVVVVSSWLQSMMTFGIMMLIFVIGLLVSGVSMGPVQCLMFFLYLSLLSLVVLGFSFFSAPAFVRFRDLNQVWEVLLLGGFYACPIIYPLAIIPEWLKPWLYLNPMTFLIEHAKAVVFFGQLSRLDHHLIYISVTVMGFVASLMFFRRYQYRIVEYL